MPQRLTASLIKNLKPKPNRFIITDNKTPGLAVVINPNGSKYFYYRYRPSGSKRIIEESVGNASVLSVEDARKAVAIKAGDVAKGINLKDQRRARTSIAIEKISDTNLQLFNYIDKYYQPYAKQHSVSADEIIKTLKREFVFIKGKPINDINAGDIDQWRSLRCEDITYARIKRIYTYLKSCINTALKHYKLIQSFELQSYTLKRRINEKVNPPKVRYLSADEEISLLKALGSRDKSLREARARYVQWQSKRNHGKKHQEPFADSDYPDHVTPIVIIAYHTGFDLGDIFDLYWEHIDFPNNQIRKIRNKTGHKQDNPQPVIIPMSPKVRSIFEQWGKQLGMSGRIFRSPRTGGRLNNISKAWKSVLKEAGVSNFRFKDLRHTFGSWLAISGTDLLEIRDLMGHKDIKTTQIYAHLCPKKKAQTVMRVFS